MSAFSDSQYLVMHRPTHKPEQNASGNYPYSWHMHGRKRIWEVRLQIRLHKIPKGQFWFGVEMRSGPAVPESAMKKRLKAIFLLIMRKTIGDSFYETDGDDPETTEGEVEPPTFALPLWAMDQFHIAEPGAEPDMTGDLANYGMKRTDGLKAYIAGMRNM